MLDVLEPNYGDEQSYEYGEYPRDNRRLLKEEEIASVEQTNESTTTFAIPIFKILLITVNACLLLYV